MKTKLKSDLDVTDAVYAFSEGVPGAVVTLMTVANEFYKASGYKVGFMLATLSLMNLSGSPLYMLFNDSCNKDPAKFDAVLNGFHAGTITPKHIDERIRNVGRGLPFDDLLNPASNIPE